MKVCFRGHEYTGFTRTGRRMGCRICRRLRLGYSATPDPATAERYAKNAAKISATLAGRMKTKAHATKIAAANKKRWASMTPRERAARTAHFKKVKFTPELRAKLSAARKAHWASLTPTERDAWIKNNLKGRTPSKRRCAFCQLRRQTDCFCETCGKPVHANCRSLHMALAHGAS